MRSKFITLALVVLIAPFVLAYAMNIQVNANVPFTTDVYQCTDSSCSSSTLYNSTTSGSYSLTGSGDHYFIEFDYPSVASCLVPHVYQIHVWEDETGTDVDNIVFEKEMACKGDIASYSLSDTAVLIDDTVTISANVESAFVIPPEVSSSTDVPSELHDLYSSNTKVTVYANGVNVGQSTSEILFGDDEDFSFSWTPSVVGSYEITVNTTVDECMCSSLDNQSVVVGTVTVTDDDCDGEINEGCTSNDTSAPIVDLFAPLSGQTFYGVYYLVNFIFGVNDESNIDGCYVNVSGVSYPSVVNISKVANNSIEVNLTEGNYSAVVFCSDSSNNVGNISEVLFSVEQFQFCSVDVNCTADYSDERYCSGDDVYETLHSFSCVSGICVENVSEEFVRGCIGDCDDGRCGGRGGDDDDDDNSWSDSDSVIYFGDSGAGESMSTIALSDSDDVGDISWTWLWIVLLIIGILLLGWMILRLLSM